MRALASIAVFGVVMSCGIGAASADPVLRSSNHFKTAAMKNELRSKTAIYQSVKPLSSSVGDNRAGAPNERSARFAKTVIANGAKPLTQQAAQPSMPIAMLKADSIDRARFKSHFAQAQGPTAREFRPGEDHC